MLFYSPVKQSSQLREAKLELTSSIDERREQVSKRAQLITC